ncbi:hypothetical protein ACLOJK_037119 [Asimina triloba]
MRSAGCSCANFAQEEGVALVLTLYEGRMKASPWCLLCTRGTGGSCVNFAQEEDVALVLTLHEGCMKASPSFMELGVDLDDRFEVVSQLN